MESDGEGNGKKKVEGKRSPETKVESGREENMERRSKVRRRERGERWRVQRGGGGGKVSGTMNEKYCVEGSGWEGEGRGDGRRERREEWISMTMKEQETSLYTERNK